MLNKLRLIITEDCNRDCVGCCNKDWDFTDLPYEGEFDGYDEVYITGGEPMLYPDDVNQALNDIYSQNLSCRVYLYTAKVDDSLLSFIYILDGVTITLHGQSDVFPFLLLNSKLPDFIFAQKSLRLNIFKGIEIDEHKLAGWIVKSDMEWIKDCPLPEGEVLKKYQMA